MENPFLPPSDATASPVAAPPDPWAPAEPQVPAEPQGATQAQPDAPTAVAAPEQTTPADTFDYKALVEQTVPKLQQYEQAFGELRQLMAAAQQQSQEQQYVTAKQQRLENAYRVAETMPPEDAIRYIRQAEDQERAVDYQALQQTRQQASQREYQIAVQLAAPQYARHLVQTNGLPAEYEQRLAMVPPQQMDQYVPHLRAEWASRQAEAQKYQALVDQINQLQRSNQATGVAASGAHAGGGTGVPTGAGGTQTRADGSLNHLLSIDGVAEMFRLR